jgi:hypothetical protein
LHSLYRWWPSPNKQYSTQYANNPPNVRILAINTIKSGESHEKNMTAVDAINIVMVPYTLNNTPNLPLIRFPQLFVEKISQDHFLNLSF